MDSRARRVARAALRVIGDSPMRGSGAYRRNRRAIQAGKVPAKYSRVAAVVPGRRVLEFGSAEGVLALLLAQQKDRVFALEQRPDRHREALRLQGQWLRAGSDVTRCEFVLGTLDEHPQLLHQVDTFVAVRSIYYLRDDIVPTFERIGRTVENVVLCGNASKAERYRSGQWQDSSLGIHNYYATPEGMTELVTKAGFEVVTTIDKGDPIVVAKKA